MPHLPLELVRMIITNVATDQAPLHPLLLISREFLHEACRALYRHIVIKTTHKRYQLPMNSATKRSYYASLVERVTIHSCRLFNDIRRILHSVYNLKTLEILGRDISDIQYVLRPDYPFHLDSFACNIIRHERLTEFFQSQPSIKTVTWDPACLWTPVAYKTTVAEATSLPNVENIKTKVIFVSSDMFSMGNIRRLFLQSTAHWYNYNLLSAESTTASRNVTSLVLFPDACSLQRILSFFPNVRYLDGNWSLVSLPLICESDL